MAQIFANNFQTTLNGGIDNEQTTIVLTSVTGFPDISAGDDYCVLTIGNATTGYEIIKVTSNSTVTLTVERAFDGTTGTNFSSGTPVSLRITRHAFESVEEGWIALIDQDLSIAAVDVSFVNLTLTKTTGTGLYVSSTEQTVDNITGSIITAGGVYIAKNTRIGGDVYIDGSLYVIGASEEIQVADFVVVDKEITLGAVGTPTNTTANGGGITLSGGGDGDKTILWDSANTNWTLNQHVNIPDTKVYKINNVSMLSSTALGSTVVNSSLTSVGTLTSLTLAGTLNLGTNAITNATNITANGTITFSALAGSVQLVTVGSGGVISKIAYATANTVSTIVQRDGSGNFAAGTITAGTFAVSGGISITNSTISNSTPILFSQGDNATVFNRANAATDANADAFVLKHTTSGNAADGFGVGFQFLMTDDTATNQTLATIRAERINSSDTTGRLIFLPKNAGSDVNGLILNPDASAVFSGAVSGITSLTVDSININGNTISSIVTNENIILDPDGSGFIEALALVNTTTGFRYTSGGDVKWALYPLKTLAGGADESLTLFTESGGGLKFFTNGQTTNGWEITTAGVLQGVGTVSIANPSLSSMTVNSVTPAGANREIVVTINGATLYIPASTSAGS